MSKPVETFRRGRRPGAKPQVSAATLEMLRDGLGLPKSATPAAIGAALTERVNGKGSPAAPTGPAAVPTVGLTLDADQAARLRTKLELDAGADAAAVVDAVTAVIDDSLEMLDDLPTEQPGQVTLTEDAYQELTTRAQVGDQSGAMVRDAYLDSRQDRFFPESRAAWERQYDLDPEMTRSYLDSAPVLYAAPTGDAPTESQDVTETDAYKEWKF